MLFDAFSAAHPIESRAKAEVVQALAYVCPAGRRGDCSFESRLPHLSQEIRDAGVRGHLIIPYALKNPLKMHICKQLRALRDIGVGSGTSEHLRIEFGYGLAYAVHRVILRSGAVCRQQRFPDVK